MNDLSTEDSVAEAASTVERPAAGNVEPAISRDPCLQGNGAVVIGTLVGLSDDGRTPLVIYPGQCASAALPALTITDVHGSHIGRQVVLIFERGNPRHPIIIGVLQMRAGWPGDQPSQVEIDADGERMIVSARERLVLRCGKASITLTKAGKILIEGAYVSSRSSGVNRIKGGSVQLN